MATLTHRVSYLTAPKSIELVQENRPTPGHEEVLVELSAVGVCGSDVHWFMDGHIGETKIDSKLTLGHEPAGRILEVGEGVDPNLIGKRVAVEPAMHCGKCKFCLEGDFNVCPTVRFMGTPPTQGAFRELIVHPAHLLVPLPDQISDEVGALLEPLAIAVHVVDLLKIKLGKTVVIQGAGPVGLATMMAARMFAPAKLIVVEPLAYRRELAKSMGADLVLSPDDPNVEQTILRATGGYGAHYVIEAAGTLESFHQMVRFAEPGGKVAVIGIQPNDNFGFNNSVARRKGLTLYMVRRSRATLERAVAITMGGFWQPEALITHRTGLGELSPAMEMVAARADGSLKVIVDPRK